MEDVIPRPEKEKKLQGRINVAGGLEGAASRRLHQDGADATDMSQTSFDWLEVMRSSTQKLVS